MDLIGLSGYAGAGKDTVAEILGDLGWVRASFADQLRAAMYALDPMVTGTFLSDEPQSLVGMVDVLGWEGAKRHAVYGTEVRRLLQRFGTEVGRKQFGEDFWVERAMAALEPAGRYVFTDCRFQNEADAIRKAGGQVWRIERPGYGPINGHPSETSLDDYPFDAHIYNGSGLGDLADAVVLAYENREDPTVNLG